MLFSKVQKSKHSHIKLTKNVQLMLYLLIVLRKCQFIHIQRKFYFCLLLLFETSVFYIEAEVFHDSGQINIILGW